MQLQFVFNGVSRKFRMIESVGFGRQFRLFTASPRSLCSLWAFRFYPGRWYCAKVRVLTNLKSVSSITNNGVKHSALS
jgi:hypothetical protein